MTAEKRGDKVMKFVGVGRKETPNEQEPAINTCVCVSEAKTHMLTCDHFVCSLARTNRAKRREEVGQTVEKDMKLSIQELKQLINSRKHHQTHSRGRTGHSAPYRATVEN